MDVCGKVMRLLDWSLINHIPALVSLVTELFPMLIVNLVVLLGQLDL